MCIRDRCSAAAEIADKVKAFLRVRVDGPNMGVQVLPLCLDTSYRTCLLYTSTSPDITKTVLKWVDGERREVKVRDGEAIQLDRKSVV